MKFDIFHGYINLLISYIIFLS